jgi:hypothetical protein
LRKELKVRKPLFAIAGLALIASGAFASLATAADHRDSPLNVANPTADINDVYAFRSPENNNNLVVAVSVNPLIVPSDNATRGNFDDAVQFQIHVDNTGDLVDDATVNIRKTDNPDALIISGLGGSITAAITKPGEAPKVYNMGGIKIFAGLRDDPFFFDLPAFQAFVAGPKVPAAGLRPAGAGAPTDAFAGTNILAIVIEAPITALTGRSDANSGTIKAWASSTRNGARIDRMAIPAINTALIPTSMKDAFNAGDPQGDATAFRPAATTQINGLRAAVDNLFGISAPQSGGPLGPLTSEQVAAALIPDIVTIDFSKPVQFPNGRRLNDDVIDVALGVVLNRGGSAGISDGVNGNDKAFSTAFPYLADPHTGAGGGAAPAPGGSTSPVRPPSTGDGGLFDNESTMWVMSAGLFLLAVGFGGAGLFAMARGRSR